MQPINFTRRGRASWPLVCLLVLAAGCAQTPQTTTPVETWAGKDLEGFPYHPLVYHLDLSILTYQLYGQSLAWPFDPYYEEMVGERDAFMGKVRAWADREGAAQVQNADGLDAYRGPGVLGGFSNNVLHDPIIYNYARLRPWNSNIVNPEGRWTEYLTPREITGQVKDVFVSYRKAGSPETALLLDRIVPERNDSDEGADNVLCAFEGGTGDKGEPGQPASQSLMGFVLLRTKPGDHYDIHIAFRGSRSGSGARAMWESFSDHKASGNPDWITDMGFDRVVPGSGAEHITTTGAVSRGFAQSMKSILPQVFNCLNKVAVIKPGIDPDNIYVTGHSMGGALAQHFVSAMLLGDLYGPGGTGRAMPASLTGWPWQQIKLITYSAPRSGDKTWARLLTQSGLDSEFFSTVLKPIDSEALRVTDASIVSRLVDTSRPAGFRVLISHDPITSEHVPGGGKHVGKTVYVNHARIRDAYLPPDIETHEPAKIRKLMLESLDDRRTPATAWRYHEINDLAPDWDVEERGSVTELQKLADAIKKYYSDNGLWFDTAAFDKDVAIRFAIYRGTELPGEKHPTAQDE